MLASELLTSGGRCEGGGGWKSVTTCTNRVYRLPQSNYKHRLKKVSIVCHMVGELWLGSQGYISILVSEGDLPKIFPQRTFLFSLKSTLSTIRCSVLMAKNIYPSPLFIGSGDGDYVTLKTKEDFFVLGPFKSDCLLYSYQVGFRYAGFRQAMPNSIYRLTQSSKPKSFATITNMYASYQTDSIKPPFIHSITRLCLLWHWLNMI